MPKLKCCNIACKYNDNKINKIRTNDYDGDDSGYCICEDEVELIGYDECPECEQEIDTIQCNNFDFKDVFKEIYK